MLVAAVNWGRRISICLVKNPFKSLKTVPFKIEKNCEFHWLDGCLCLNRIAVDPIAVDFYLAPDVKTFESERSKRRKTWSQSIQLIQTMAHKIVASEKSPCSIVAVAWFFFSPRLSGSAFFHSPSTYCRFRHIKCPFFQSTTRNTFMCSVMEVNMLTKYHHIYSRPKTQAFHSQPQPLVDVREYSKLGKEKKMTKIVCSALFVVASCAFFSVVLIQRTEYTKNDDNCHMHTIHAIFCAT